MKTSVKSQHHTGEQPIRVLKHNISHRFENIESDFNIKLQDMINSKKLFPGINYHISNRSLLEKQMPYVDANGVINLHETFMSYVWIMSFSLFVLYEEAVAKPMQKQQGQLNIADVNIPLLHLTEELFEYGKSLVTSYSIWDKNYFPNPEEYSADDVFYVERTNGLYLYAMTFILCHEFAHVEFEHFAKLNKVDQKTLETEADKRAIELVLKSKDGQNDKSVEYGILIGLVSLLFIRKSASGKGSHPDSDERIIKYLETINPDFDEPIWGVACLGIKLWDNQFKHNFDYPKYVNDFKEFFYHLVSQIKK
ncbi:phage exclusion protein Lit family protein [Flavobacterium silvaticum]|uniref:Peptidase U49 n=1 Tax=Flavobacterium silvaticum TaxID=1852020 RepID=A0A972FNL8_9FLAO|nr:phage exclusion protein Lit family protein [Flavobacterium silvaticum]NMH26554.1 hypothetical protein [Flavobacterium silvaticum]